MAHLDVLLVTALGLERLAVRSHLSDVTVEQASGLGLDVGELRGPSRPLSVGVLEAGMGNVSASILTARAEEFFRPPIIVMVGIAGGLKDVAIGDVVVSSKVYWVEAGKQLDHLLTRPDFAPVSPSLVQAARALAADQRWHARVPEDGDATHIASSTAALVAPIVAGEKVLAETASSVVAQIRRAYGDAVAVDMEDYGALKGGSATERAKVIAVRGISDLIDGKADSDAEGSQPVAARNAAAFAMELILASQAAPSASQVDTARLAALAAELYPEGPQQHAIWERAGGDPSRLSPAGPGFARWWEALRLVERGGGGTSMQSIVETMWADFPDNSYLKELRALG